MAETPSYWLTRLVFQRGLAVVYLLGFLIAVNQFRPLLGMRGLLPVPLFLDRASFWEAPSLFWIHYSDRLASLLAWLGVALSVAAFSGVSERFGTPPSMAVWGMLWLLYLSFVNVGQTFYGFGWETLLLETGFLAIFLGGRDVPPPAVVIWLLRWVLFRVMFGAGLIKLRGDPCWRDLTCLTYHYETQPLPNPFSWYLHRLPLWVDKAGVLFTHFAELIVPWGAFAPVRWVRYAAGGAMIGFQVLLIMSGNLSWLNYITIVLAISCFDDRAWRVLFSAWNPPLAAHRPAALDIATVCLAVLVAALSIRPALNLVSSRQAMNRSFEPLHLVNTYGAFGGITRERMEVVFEGTADSVAAAASAWREYEFKGKPGTVTRAPPIVSPYHWRLDWQMWFAAMSPYYYHPWIVHLAVKLLENDRPVIGLLANDPFPQAPPRVVRARLYRYRFTTPDERRRTGAWWKRTYVEEYLPPLSLSDPALQRVLEGEGWER